jgi:hypothetical protein
MKKIIIDHIFGRADVELRTEGFEGPKCKEESEFLKDALGKVVEENLTTAYFIEETVDDEVKILEGRSFKPFCG